MTATGSPVLEHWLHPLGAEEVRAVDQLQEALRVRRRGIFEQWQTLYRTHFGPHRALPEPLLEDTYVPLMGGALSCMARGDVTGFTDMAGALGDEMARVGVPFVAVVAHLNLLKESCLQALTDDPAWQGRAPVLLERLNASFVSAAAGSYYQRRMSQPDAAGNAVPLLPAPAIPIARP